MVLLGSCEVVHFQDHSTLSGSFFFPRLYDGWAELYVFSATSMEKNPFENKGHSFLVFKLSSQNVTLCKMSQWFMPLLRSTWLISILHGVIPLHFKDLKLSKSSAFPHLQGDLVPVRAEDIKIWSQSQPIHEVDKGYRVGGGWAHPSTHLPPLLYHYHYLYWERVGVEVWKRGDTPAAALHTPSSFVKPDKGSGKCWHIIR